jgi:AcrR family transcriptional regulator
VISNKEKIIECSIKLFSTKGYEAVGVQEIADTASITKPTLYHYFGSKRGLLDKIIAEYEEKYFNLISPYTQYNRDIVKNLNELAFAFIKFAQTNMDFYRMQLNMYFAPPESEAHKAISHMNLKAHGIIEELFKFASKDHGNMKGREKEYSAAYIGTINTYIGMWLNGYCELTEALVYRIVHQFMHGIFS